MKRFQKLLILFMTVVLFCGINNKAYAADFSSVADGIYVVDANLSCYVNAMGGVEFGAPLLTGATVTVTSGKATVTLSFVNDSVTIYGITCDTFIDASPAGAANGNGLTPGTIGYYDKKGVLQTSNVNITLSSTTVLNSANELVPYVASMSFPLDQMTGTYQLALYVNSNVMGCQFGGDSYPATLTVDWSSLPVEESSSTEETTVSNDSNNSGTGNNSGSGANSNAGNSSGTNISTGSNSGVNNNTNSGSTAGLNSSGNSSAGDNTSLDSSVDNTSDSTKVNSTLATTASGEEDIKAETIETNEAPESTETVEDTTVTLETADVEVVENDGLTIYFANGETIEAETEGTTESALEDEQGLKGSSVVIIAIVTCAVIAISTCAVVAKKKLKKVI